MPFLPKHSGISYSWSHPVKQSRTREKDMELIEGTVAKWHESAKLLFVGSNPTGSYSAIPSILFLHGFWIERGSRSKPLSGRGYPSRTGSRICKRGYPEQTSCASTRSKTSDCFRWRNQQDSFSKRWNCYEDVPIGFEPVLGSAPKETDSGLHAAY